MGKLKPTQLLLFSFATIIFSGTALLKLPAAAAGKPLSFIEALFSATSATCVTGLTVIDISVRLTHFGQIVIISLIQIGGLGIMTFSTFFIFLISKRFSIRDRELLQQTLSQQPVKDLASLLKSVFGVTIVIESVGVLFYFLRFSKDFAGGKALYFSVFHSVSAFCNAGFSLFPDSFVRYQDDLIINFTTMILILLGGVGFIVLFDLYKKIRKKKTMARSQFSFHSRVVLHTSFWLIISGAALFFVFDFFNQLQPLSWSSRIVTALFQSVTSRTAGFNTVDIGAISNSSLFLISMLMLIGASPASCGGGMKTTSFAVLTAMVAARFRNREDVHLFHRRIDQDVISKAVSIGAFSFIIIALFTLVLLFTEVGGLSHVQTRGSFLDILFEVVSAFGTVGLSTGITADFSNTGRILLVLLMYIGRLGPITLAMAITGEHATKLPYRYAKENLLVG